MKIKPVRWGIALTAAGTALSNIGGISQLNGAHGDLIFWTVMLGFFAGVIGTFLTVLFSNGYESHRPRQKLDFEDNEHKPKPHTENE